MLSIKNPAIHLEIDSCHEQSIISKELPKQASLIDLLKMLKYNQHILPLSDFLQNILNKMEQFPQLDELQIKEICQILNCNTNNEIHKNISQIVKSIAKQESNKTILSGTLLQIVQELSSQVALSFNSLSVKNETEQKIYKVCLLLKSIDSQIQINLNDLWEKLSSTLDEITENSSEISIAANPKISRLLPVIEAFFLTQQDAFQIKNVENLLSTPQRVDEEIKEEPQTFVYKFCEKNKKVINMLIKQNPSSLNDSFRQIMLAMPSLIDFDNKRQYFKSELKKLQQQKYHSTIQLTVSRNKIFFDSYKELKQKNPEAMYGKIQITFRGEEGIDAGGLLREWYLNLSKEIFNPNYALFMKSAGGVTFQPNPNSGINQDHLLYFKFVGRFIAKALIDGQLLDAFFTHSFYKHILSQQVSYTDMEDLDPEFFKNLKWLLEQNLDDKALQGQYYFCTELDEFGKITIIDLIPDGRNVAVTEANKTQYVKLLCHHQMTKNIKQQLQAFLEGFYELIPKQIISIFDPRELELIISGMPDIDIEDLKANTEYYNYSPTSPIIKWLWEILEQFDESQKAAFIQFVTGTSKVPLEGFKSLQGIGGIQKFNIHKSFEPPDHLPTAHTCVNQLDLPEYTSKQMLAERLTVAILEGKDGFGFI